MYYYFRSWQISGLWKRINRHVVEQERIKQDRFASPSVAIIDSQSIKNRERGLGVDSHKKIQGRKRHLVIDSLRLALAVMVSPANNHDACAAKMLLQKLALVGFKRMKIIIGDGAYEHLAEWLLEKLKWVLQVFKRSDTAKTPFEVLPQRWKVEMTISWLMWSRRLPLDYEADTKTSETFILIANIQFILRKT
ncbi:MAG: IS5 family transposase [Haliscomenobacter sp.]|uniref:IS5 family transposase n=1 Tax=Haliscomenobacter sp. TaxID=2717303 RepID=UPI0029B65710|nr:IS5 family transposase [Haliscomenobacter sp.]MDX2067861.1 IS5 family transposase [Haliscomenobacter sp.]